MDFSFVPNTFDVEVNTKFEMQIANNGSVAHTFMIDEIAPNPEGLASDIDSVIQPGDHTRMILTFKSNVTFYCRFHRDRGMTGLLQTHAD